jgi:Tfp pilus assembly PilM family ATPase
MNPVIDHIPSAQPDAVKRSFLERAFPVPRSLILSDVALYVADGTLRYFEFSRSRGKVHPKKFGSSPFPRFHLAALDEKMKADAVASLKKWAVDNRYSAVRAVVHEDEAYVFKVTVPTASEGEIRAAIEGVLEENVPIPPGDAIFEYDVIAVDQKLQETTVAVSVLSHNSILESIGLFETAGLSVISLDTEARALARALFSKGDRGVHVVLSLTDHHSIVFIVENGAVVFSSSLKTGSIDLDKAIARAFNITEAEARKMKLEKAFTDIDGDTKCFEAMLPVFSFIRDELAKVLVYWKGQAKHERHFRDVNDIVLCGSDAMIAGFDRYVAVTAKTPTRVGSVWTNVLSINENVPELPRRESLDYGVVIGTLL